jgi:hypothetical protein
MEFVNNPWVTFALCALTLVAVLVVVFVLLAGIGLFRTPAARPPRHDQGV